MSKGNAEDKDPKEPLKLFDNPLDSFRNGACMDLRVRIAMDMLIHNPFFTTGGVPSEIAMHALDIASELVYLADARGLMRSLDDPKGMEELKAHVRRQVEFQIENGNEQRRQSEQGVKLARAVS